MENIDSITEGKNCTIENSSNNLSLIASDQLLFRVTISLYPLPVTK
jgi:hypothetical protein